MSEMLLRLEARDASFLTTVRVPQSYLLPEIVMWSGRMFVPKGVRVLVNGCHLYREAVSITVVDPTPTGATIVP